MTLLALYQQRSELYFPRAAESISHNLTSIFLLRNVYVASVLNVDICCKDNAKMVLVRHDTAGPLPADW